MLATLASFSPWHATPRASANAALPHSLSFFPLVQEVTAILGDTFPFEIVAAKIDLPELQGEPEEVRISRLLCARVLPRGGGWVVLARDGFHAPSLSPSLVPRRE
jgi:hypothetical protein